MLSRATLIKLRIWLKHKKGRILKSKGTIHDSCHLGYLYTTRLAWLMNCTLWLMNSTFLCFNQILDFIRVALDNIFLRFYCPYPLIVYLDTRISSVFGQMSHPVITRGHSTAWYQIRRVENVSKKYIFYQPFCVSPALW